MAFATRTSVPPEQARTLFRVGRLDDARERDADRIATRVMQAPVNGRAHKGPRPHAGPAPGITGQPLDDVAREFFEPRFHHDFSNVRVHTDQRATASAETFQAAAFSVGEHLFFRPQLYAPETAEGRKLLAHELAHVVQQRAGSGPPVLRRVPWGAPHRPPAVPSTTPQPTQPQPQQAKKTAPEPFFHGTTWRIAQQIPGNVKPVGGGDFGQGFYTHHDADATRAHKRARDWACRLSRESKPPEQYAGVIRFDVPPDAYQSLFNSRKTFDFTSTTDPAYARKQKEWLDFVSGPGRGREAKPVYDPQTGFWRHPRSNPDPDLGFDLIEGPFYRGVPDVMKPIQEPPRSAFEPYAEGTALPQQVVWNHDRAMAVLNAAPTTLFQYDVQNECSPVPQPHAVAPLSGPVTEDRAAREAAQREMTDVPNS